MYVLTVISVGLEERGCAEVDTVNWKHALVNTRDTHTRKQAAPAAGWPKQPPGGVGGA